MKTDSGARISAVLGFLALPALLGVGTAWGVYRRRGWEEPPAVRNWPKTDLRLDPAWVRRDRRLRAATIGVGAVAGTWLLSMPVTYGIGVAVVDNPDCSQPDSCNAPISGDLVVLILILTEGALAGASLLALAGVGGASGAHRRPLRRWNMSLAPGGLEIRF
ncbi:hypothetical protein [Nannocystis pusilla]|uniref:hypothetical protein n=1 Tax=Nannocystis pusilla TaxID=889268 RepID=UPI003DA362D8